MQLTEILKLLVTDMTQVFGELNSFAFLVDLGVYEPIPSAITN